LEFLLKVFPCGKFILNFREDIDKQVASSIKNNMAVKNKDSIQSMTQSLIHFAQSKTSLSTFDPQDQFYSMPLESFNNMTVWRHLFRWLGRPQCRATDVLRVNEGGFSPVGGGNDHQE
jgi:hypothetical protein